MKGIPQLAPVAAESPGRKDERLIPLFPVQSSPAFDAKGVFVANASPENARRWKSDLSIFSCC